ncbi:hypothetical protein GCM10022245_19930 [Streptomyces mayteni]
MSLVAARQGAMLLCRPMAEYHVRADVVFVPVTGLPDSVLGLVARRGHVPAPVRALAGFVTGAVAGAAPGPQRSRP